MSWTKNIKFLITRAWKAGKSYCLLTAANNIFQAVLPLINIVGLGMVVDALVIGEPRNQVMQLIIIYLSINLGIAIIKELLQLFENNIMRRVSNVAQFEWSNDSVNVNYHYAQDGTILNLRRKSMGVSPAFYINYFGKFISYIVQFAGIISILSLLSPIFLLLIAATSAVSIALIFKTKKNDFDFQNGKVEEDRKIDYLYSVMTGYKFAKEVRINNAEEYVANKYSGILQTQINKLKTLYKKTMNINLLSTIITITQTAVMYFYFSYQVFSNRITIAEYTVLLSTTTLLTSLLLGFFDNIAQFGRLFKTIDFYYEYKNLMDNHSNITASNNLNEQNIDFSNAIIKFENVSFIYPGTDKVILKNINFEIKKGEKIGMVGLNGSGKTTFVKLLTRLYDPTEGRITLNGVDIKSIPHRQYIKHIGIVLQDFLLFAYSVKENVILDTEYDEIKFMSSIEKSGLREKIGNLKNGIDTSVYKTLNGNGVEFSGGEGQKLALARAIYKDAETLILDEPTSALDPIAEYELFSKLNDISENKATVFISHRLSSTKFCDKIIVLSDGEIIECGNHDELMKQNEFYADLFNSQARYYRDMGVQSMNKFFSKFAAPLEIIKIIAKHEPLYLLYAMPQIVLNAVLPLLYVYFPKLIIEQLTNGNPYGDVIKTISIYLCILLVINVINVFLKNKSGMRSTLFSSKLKNEIGKISMRLELADIESPQSRDMVQMANKAADLTGAMGLVQNIISNIITIIGLAYIIVRLDWLFILLVTIILIIKAIFVYIHYLYGKKIRKLDAENNRFGDYLYQISFSSEGGAKEIRLNSLQKWYMDKVTVFRNTMVNMQFGDFKRYAVFNIIMAILLALQSFMILWLLSGRYIDGVISIAEFTMYFAAISSLTASLSAISEQFGNYNRQILNATDYKNFMNLTSIKENEVVPDETEFTTPNKTEFVFKNICFTYPNTDKQILDNINIKISDKEKLVIVGMNGAGKSTFIKLLCKFYRPTSGIITLNGVDIWDIPNDEYYKIISAVFQDFANLSFTFKENIAMNEDCKLDKISQVIKDIGLKDRADELPNGYDTYLSRNFDSGGVEFSGGQAQKIAIARAVYKDTPVLILDEPTASLDPKAESEIYTDFFNIAKNKTTIFISHRLAASTVADNIAVFSDGKIAEYGSHNDLMNHDGIYAEMYRKQSQHYVDERKIF